jgi:choline dehydrogenase
MSGETYDTIVVGAGASGCVLARRLIDRGARVLLVEAGGPDDSARVHDTGIGAVASIGAGPDLVWPHETTAQPSLGGRTVPIPQGRVLGGGTSVGTMMYVRGNRRDFDGWAAQGNPGWAYDDVLEYFRRSEDFADGASHYRGAGGPMAVSHYERASDASRAFAKAAAERGHRPPGFDYNGEQQEDGPFFYQSARTKDHRRASTAAAFLQPVLDRPDLTVRTGAHATRVLIEGSAATGVEFTAGGAVHRAYGNEIVLACGALTTPQLLLLSGIGPEAELARHGIRPVADLPGVGRNLQDHLRVGVTYASLVDLPAPALVAEAGMFCRTRGGDGPPDLQFFFGPTQAGPGFTFAPILVRPRSRGSVTLRSADPADLPVVHPNYLVDRVDVNVLVSGIEIARDLARADAFTGIGGPELSPGADVTDRADVVRYIRDTATSMWHPAGTARMGRDTDPDAVVDARLRVHGIDRLRIADASIMPTVTCGGTAAATIMIGEKAADLIGGGRP